MNMMIPCRSKRRTPASAPSYIRTGKSLSRCFCTVKFSALQFFGPLAHGLHQIDLEWWIHDTIFGHDPGQQSVRCDVEGRVARLRIIRRDLLTEQLQTEYFLCITFLDRDHIPVCEGKVHSRRWNHCID